MTAIRLEAATASPGRVRAPRVLPGFGLSLGMTIAWLRLIVLVPLCALVLRP